MGCNQRARGLAALILAVVVASLAGCGGGSSSASSDRGQAGSASSSSAPSSDGGEGETQFIAQADAVCTRLSAEIDAVKPKNGSRAEVERVVPRNAKLEKAGLLTLEQLSPPASLKSTWKRMLQIRRELAVGLPKLVSAVKRDDGPTLTALTESKKSLRGKLRQTGTASGFKACSTVG